MLVGLVLAVIIAVVIAVATSGGGHGNPDPGGIRLKALTAATAAALPSDAQVTLHGGGEPRWDSCDGRAGTFGWDDIMVDYQFTTEQPPGAMVAAAARAWQRLGWAVSERTSPLGPIVSGSRSVGPGDAMRVVLGAQQRAVGDAITWGVDGDAPPTGQRSSGC
jgi:hypothetical protein